MSTAEQIIAEALVQWSLEPCCRTCAGGLAAHVVAALTNAGKTIVELPEGEAGAWLGGRVRAEDGAVALALAGMAHLEYFPHAARRLATALLAAARVAERGERGE